MARWSILDRNAASAGVDVVDPVAVDPALTIVDDALVAFAGRSLVTGDEVMDCLLDLRSALAAATLLRELEAAAITPR